MHPTKKYIVGGGRGAMEMFLALQRYPALQNYFEKCVSVSGLVDIKTLVAYRQGMKDMFTNHFGLTSTNENEWLTYRNPIEHCDKFKDSFPILLIHGTDDHRGPLEEARNMVAQLQALGKKVTYWEWHGADHGFTNKIDERNAAILK